MTEYTVMELAEAWHAPDCEVDAGGGCILHLDEKEAWIAERENGATQILPHHDHDEFAFYRGDGSERCLVCGGRSYPSWYVGGRDRVTDEGLPERFAVCSEEHGLWLMTQLDQER